MGIKGHQQNKFVRFITIPFRILRGNLPKSFSVSSSRCGDDEDFRELIRAASARTSVDRIDMDLILKQQATQSAMSTTAGSKGLPKSASVGMGKIDEDRPCDFEEVGVDGRDVKANLFYPRSRSYAVTKRSVVY
ncbi:hypothetical protein SLA2020_442390 [Shorea laevis]